MQENFVLEHIRDLCEKEQWTNYELAKRSGVPQSTIVNMFSRTNVPTLPTLIKLCSAFGITISQFFSDPSEYPDLTLEQKELLLLYDSLNTYHKSIAKEILKVLSEDRFPQTSI